MRWGVTDDSTNDHSVEKLCLLEVENCQKISLGPNFVVCKNISALFYVFNRFTVELNQRSLILIHKVKLKV